LFLKEPEKKGKKTIKKLQPLEDLVFDIFYKATPSTYHQSSLTSPWGLVFFSY